MLQAVALAPRTVRFGALVPVAVLMTAGWAVLAVARDHAALGEFAGMWAAMTIAMMIPTVVRPMLRAADGSVARAWTFLAGFATVWLAAGVPTFVVMNAIAWTPFWLAAAWFAAGAYQLTPVMHRHLGTCRSVRFRGDPLAYGLRQGWRCVASCWPVMLAVMVTAMALPGTALPLLALVAVTALLCWEKEPGTTRRAVTGVGMAMLLVAAGAFALAGGGGAVHHSDEVSVGASMS
jgi:predicted metal-binding membrane protein